MPKGQYERPEAPPLTEQDREFAKMLLEWSHSLDEKLTTWEHFYLTILNSPN